MTPGAKLAVLGPRFNPYRLPNTEAVYSLDVNPSDMTYIKDASNRLQLVADRSGNSATTVMNFVAPTSGATITNLAAFGSADFSFAVLIRFNAVNLQQNIFSSSTGNVADFSFQLTAAGKFQISGYNGGVASVTSNTAISANTEYWACAVRSSGVTTWYLNGVADGSAAQAGTFTQHYLLGRSVDGSPFTGYIRNLIIYTRALSAGEVLTLVQTGVAPSGSNVLNSSITSASKLAATVADASGNSATITLPSDLIWLSGARDLVQLTQAKQPIYLPWQGANYGYLNGVAGNYFSSPDSAALSITGDIDLRVQAAPISWAVTQKLICKEQSSSTSSYHLGTDVTTGKLVLQWSTNGSDFPSAISTVGTGFAANSRNWVRATLRVSDGRVQFFTGSDGVNWVQLGADVTGGVTSIFDSTSKLELGSQRNGSINLFSGNLYRAQVYNGIAGTMAFDFDAANYSSGTTFLDASANAATITLNGGAHILTQTCAYFDGVNDYLKAAAFSLSQPESVYFVGSQITWIDGHSVFDGNTTNLLRVRQDTTTPQLNQFSGSGGAQLTTLALSVRALLTAIFSGAASSLALNRSSAVVANAGTSAAAGFTLGANGDGTNSTNITVSEVIIRSVADPLSVELQHANFLIPKWNIAA